MKDINLDLPQYKSFDKKSSGANTSGGAVTGENKSAIKSELCQNNN